MTSHQITPTPSPPAIPGQYGSLLRGRVLKAGPITGTWMVSVPAAAPGSSWGPMSSLAPDIVAGDLVLLAQVGTTRGDLVIIGKVPGAYPAYGSLPGLTAALAALSSGEASLNASVTSLNTGVASLNTTVATTVRHGDLMINAKDYGAKIDGRRLRNITATAAGTTVTDNSGLANFTSADVGKKCAVYLDGDQDTTSVVGTVTTIAAVVDATHVTLSVVAGLTASGTSAYFLYGTDDSTALAAAFTAAATLTSVDTTVGPNEPQGLGRPTVLIPASSPASLCVLGSALTVPSGTALLAQSFLANLLADRFAPCLIVNPYARLADLLGIEVLYGTGVQLGNAAGTQADVHFGSLVLWHVGKTREVGGATRYPDAVAALGYGFLGGLIWTKGGARALSMNAGSDMMLDRLFAIGAHCAVSMSQSNQVSLGEITMDSCGIVGGGYNGIELDNACSDIRLAAKAFVITGSTRSLDNVLIIGKTSTNKCVDIRAEISAQATGGVALSLANAQDIDVTVLASNTASPSSGGGNVTTAVAFGTVAGSCRVASEMNGSITPYTGTPPGIYRYTRGGVEYRVQGGSAPAGAAVTANGTSPPAPTVTGNDQRGSVSFGSGTGPTTGTQVTLTFASATGWVTTAPYVQLQALNAATTALQPYVASCTATVLSIGFGVAPTAGQAVGTYKLGYRIEG
jgi:hypothetical protein